MLKRALVFGAVGVSLAVLYTGVAFATRYRRTSLGYLVECSPSCGGTATSSFTTAGTLASCGGTATSTSTTASLIQSPGSPSVVQTVEIEGIMGLREGPVRINEVSELVVEVFCQHQTNGTITGNVITGPFQRIFKTAKFTVVEDPGSFSKSGDTARAVLEFNPDEFVTDEIACPGEAFELVRAETQAFHYEDKIVACQKFNKQGVCVSPYTADILTGDCDLVSGGSPCEGTSTPCWDCTEIPDFHHEK